MAISELSIKAAPPMGGGFEHGRHLCPKCGGWVPGAIDVDEYRICKLLRRDSSWAWCEECKEAFAEERAAMLAAKPKLGCATLTVAHLAQRRKRQAVEIVCDVCGEKFMGQRGQRRCGKKCRRVAAARTQQRNYGKHRATGRKPGRPARRGAYAKKL